MGNILLGGFGLLAIIVLIVYLAKDKEMQEEYDEGWKGWWVDWLDGEERGLFIALAVAIVLVGWGICSIVTHAMVTERHKEQRESIVYSYQGTGDKNFTVARDEGCYVVMEKIGENLKEIQLYENNTSLVVGTLDNTGSEATLIKEITVKKVKRSEMPFMFFNGKDKIKESEFCGCSGSKYILKVPANFVFIDKHN